VCFAEVLLVFEDSLSIENDKSLTGEPMLPSRTANQYLARYWFAVRDGNGSPVRDQRTHSDLLEGCLKEVVTGGGGGFIARGCCVSVL
jgi:hypothetical protein